MNLTVIACYLQRLRIFPQGKGILQEFKAIKKSKIFQVFMFYLQIISS